MTRRNFLKLSALTLPAMALPPLHSASHPTLRTPSTITRFLDPLPIPKRLAPVGKSNRIAEYAMRMSQFRQKLHSQLPPTTVWGFEGTYPGPIIEAERGQAISMRWENHLPQKHLFLIDPAIHGAMLPMPSVRTVPHLHGAHTASQYDGLPERWFTPGHSVTYRYPNQQRAAMLWYHDHAMGITRLNNYAGLAGVYFIRDQEERSQNLPSGEYEIPLVLQDRNLSDDAQLLYTPTNMMGEVMENGRWGPEFFGSLAVVNGALYPVLEVEPRLYRFRVLNAANSRFFRLSLYDLAMPLMNVGERIWQIGGDGGLLPSPVPHPRMLLGPGERLDLLADFTSLEGREFTLSNRAPAPFSSPYEGAEENNEAHAFPPLVELIKIRVSRPLSGAALAGVSASKPSWSLPMPRLEKKDAAVTRDFVLSEKVDARKNSLGVRINDMNYDDPVTEKPRLNATEIWRFINTTDDSHPMHIHLVQFLVLERARFDLPQYLSSKQLKITEIRAAEGDDQGWKDTVRADSGEILSLLVRFTGYTGRYVFHCHMLEHEDNETMRPFEIVA